LNGIVPAVGLVPLSDRAILEQDGGLHRGRFRLLRKLARGRRAGESAFGKWLGGAFRVDENGERFRAGRDEHLAFKRLGAGAKPLADRMNWQHQFAAELEYLVERSGRLANHEPR